MRITALVDSKNANWLKLAGINVHVYTDPGKDGRTTLRNLITGEDYGIIICTPEIIQVNQEIVQEAIKSLIPMIIELPTSERPAAIQDLVRSAIGVDIKL
ncbi:MAG: V-type ATP synthase subunit F [Candidatus Hodarchaeales archaeon]|jgi:vacuolar-type H+-ATPase subunit F/Vma7